MNAIGFCLTLILAMVILGGGRTKAALAIVCCMMFIPMSQQVSLAGFNVYSMRFLGFLLFLRVLARGEFSFSQMNTVDKLMLWMNFFGTLVFCIRSDGGQAYVIATSLDMLFGYFGFRGLFQDIEDFKPFLLAMVFPMFLLSGLVAVEFVTHHNALSIMGGLNFGWIRSGRLRCFGPFQNPDLLGTFGASFMPLYAGLSRDREHRNRCYTGIFLCLWLVFACNSGGPVSSLASAMIGWLLWRMRSNMKKVRNCILGLLVMVAILMKAPIWYIFARMSQVTGGDGWHRSYLIDVSVRHIELWWFWGMPLKDTADWFPYKLSTTGAADIANQYLVYGLRCGLGLIFLFVMMLTKAYKLLGLAMAEIRSRVEGVTTDEVILWAFGVLLIVHVVNWFGISYFDQSYMLFCLQFGALVSLSQAVLDNPPEPLPENETSSGNLGLNLQPVGEYEIIQ